MSIPVADRWDIGPVLGLDIVAMPVLDAHVKANTDALAGVSVLYINHAISDALMVARGFRRIGARVCSVLVPYHGRAGDTQHALRRAFKAVGPTYHPAQTHPARFADVMARTVKQAIISVARSAALDRRPWMIVEDGGYAFPALHDDPDLRVHLTNCLGAVEHTTRGRWNYEYAELDCVPRTARILDRPAVTISGSALKTAHEGGFVAQALLDECHWLLRRDHQFLRHRRVAVVGYGRVGKALARAIAQTDAQVLVVDPAGHALEPGMQRSSLDDAVANGALLVFGATGTSSFTNEALHRFLHSGSDLLYLASASSKAVEFSDVINELEAAGNRTTPTVIPSLAVRVEPDPPVGTRYHISLPDGRDKQIVLLGNGYPIIFYPPDTHGAPNRAMDPVMTQLFLAAAGLPAAAPFLSQRVHDLADLRRITAARLPRPWQALTDEAGLLAQWCVANGISWPDYAHRIGFPAQASRPAPVGPS